MRTPLLFFCASLAASAMAANKLVVVVHTTDTRMHVVHYAAPTQLTSLGQPRSIEVMASTIVACHPGTARWHAVGGVAPYRLIESWRTDRMVCFVVQDAAGEVAVGTGVIGVSTTEEYRKVGSTDGGSILAAAGGGASEGAVANGTASMARRPSLGERIMDERARTKGGLPRGTRSVGTAGPVGGRPVTVYSRPAPAPTPAGDRGAGARIGR